LRSARIALATCTTTQLPVSATAFMPFRTDDRTSSSFLHSRSASDIRTTSRHVGGDGYRTRKASLSYNLRFPRVLFCVQYIVWNLLRLQHPAQQFTYLDRSGTNKHRPSGIAQGFNLIDHRLALFSLGLVNKILPVVADHWEVGRNRNHIQLVDAPKLCR